MRRRRGPGAVRPLAARTVAALLATVLATLPGVLATAGPAAADRRDDVDRRLVAAGEQLETLDAQADRATAALQTATAQLPAAQARLAAAQHTLLQAQAADRRAAAALARATTAVIRAEQDLAAQEDAIADLRDDVGALARAAYQQGPYAEIDLLLQSQDPGDFTSRLAALDAVGRANTQALSRMSAARADLALTEVRLEALRADVQQQRQEVARRYAAARSAQAEAATAKAEVDRLVAQRRDALAAAESRRATVLARYRALQAEQQRLAEEARQAALAAAQAAGGSGGSGGSGGAPAGDLVWPIPGGTTSGQVGPRVHPVYGYRSCHTGIDIRGGYGTPIHAAASGVVASVVNGGPYGLHTLIAHSGGLVTMYAHQSSTAVGAGESVSAGQVIGYVGATGYATGPHLHFEVHVNGVPYNPLGWFGGPRFAISC